MKSTFRLLVGLTLGVALFISSAIAGDVSVFGPQVIERGKGQPVLETFQFSVSNPSDQFVLKIVNGDDSEKSRISSLSLTINGVEQASQEEFNQQVGLIEKPISLAQSNLLAIMVDGKPGTFVEVSILGGDGGTVIVPTATLTVTPEAIEEGQAASLKWLTSNADTVTIEPGLGVVAPNGEQSVSPSQTTTYTLTAERGSEEAVSTATLTVTAVALPPSVTVSVSPSSINSGEAATLSWQSSNADSVTIEPGIGAVGLAGSLSVSPLETTTYVATASKGLEQASAQTTLQVETQPTGPYVSIDDIDGQTPNGASINRSYVTISGTIHGEFEPEIGVTVNGGLAEVFGHRFIMNHLPIVEGWNTINVIASDSSGLRAESNIEVYSSKPAVTMLLTADRYAGGSPFDNLLTVYLEPNQVIAESNIDCVGGTPVTITPISTLEYGAAFTAPGLYECQATITDGNGHVYLDSVGVQVWDSAQLDQMLQAKWAAMKTSLLNADIESALSFFAIANRAVFEQQFRVLEPGMAEFVGKMGEFKLEELKEGRAIYDLRVFRDGQEFSFQASFIKDEDGIWRIWAF